MIKGREKLYTKYKYGTKRKKKPAPTPIISIIKKRVPLKKMG